jgi:hypothetical protein
MNSKNILVLLLIAGLIITIYGLVTGQFYFLFLIIPLGFLFNRNKKK